MTESSAAVTVNEPNSTVLESLPREPGALSAELKALSPERLKQLAQELAEACKAMHEQRASRRTDPSFLLTLLVNIDNERRSRRQPEYLYVAAALGAFGATAWGVTALDTAATPAALVAAAAVAALAYAVGLKIDAEHKIYNRLWVVRNKLAGELRNLGFAAEAVDHRPCKSTSGPGYKLSKNVLRWAAIGAAAICVAVFILGLYRGAS